MEVYDHVINPNPQGSAGDDCFVLQMFLDGDRLFFFQAREIDLVITKLASKGGIRTQILLALLFIVRGLILARRV